MLNHKPSNIQYFSVLCKTLACEGFLNRIQTSLREGIWAESSRDTIWPWAKLASCGDLVLPLWLPWVSQDVFIWCSPNPQTKTSYQIRACASGRHCSLWPKGAVQLWFGKKKEFPITEGFQSSSFTLGPECLCFFQLLRCNYQTWLLDGSHLSLCLCNSHPTAFPSLR